MAGTINAFPISTKGWSDFALNTAPADSDLIMGRDGATTSPFTIEVSKQTHGGIIPWTASFNFKAGNYTDRNGLIYRAEQDNLNQDPVTDSAGVYWFPVSLDLKAGKNYIIDGAFQSWQEATSQTSNGYGSDDMAQNVNVGSTKTHSQQTFTLGQTDVPGNPEFYSRTVVTSVAGASNYVSKVFAIEDVETLSGEEVTLSFWAKADSAKDIATEVSQNFGTGGSPSVSVNAIGVATHSLTTSWQRFETTFTITSVSGATLGTDGNDKVEVNFWFDAGSTFNSRTNTLGQQSGTFDIWGVKLEKGDFASNFEIPSKSETLDKIQRYLRILRGDNSTERNFASGFANGTDVGEFSFYFGDDMRDTPSVSVSSVGIFRVLSDTTSVTSTGAIANSPAPYGTRLTVTSTGAGWTTGEGLNLALDSSDADYIKFDARL